MPANEIQSSWSVRGGRLLFRTRNVLFPIVFAALLLLFPPVARRWGLAALGFALVLLGEGLRVVTLGFTHVGRGGKDGKFFARGLTTEGLFAHVRNPLYLGNLGVVAGTLLVAGNEVALALGLAFFLFAYALLVRGEEAFLGDLFPEAYADYRRTVPRWIPRLRGLPESLRGRTFHARRVLAKEHGSLFLALFLLLLVLFLKTLARGGWPLARAEAPFYGAVAALLLAAWITVRLLKKSGRLRPPPPRPRS